MTIKTWDVKHDLCFELMFLLPKTKFGLEFI